MKAVSTHKMFRISPLIVVGVGSMIWNQSCFSDVDTYTPVKVTVQDSTGRPLPGFRLEVIGSTSGTFGGKPPTSVEENFATTDMSGSFQTNLHWHDKIDYFVFSYTHNPNYPNAGGSIAFLPPLDSYGQLTYDKVSPNSTTLITIPVILR